MALWRTVWWASVTKLEPINNVAEGSGTSEEWRICLDVSRVA